MYKNILKRFFDIYLSLLGIILAAPILLVVTIALAIANNGQPFFFQARPGKGGQLFHIIKFKTMNDKTDANGNLLPDADRLTPWGKIVRKTSLDELPQLFNVFSGSMSLIGPRPLLPQYLPLYSPEQARRHEVRPGITGWAQVNGRNSISWEDKFRYDVYYVDHLSFILDLRILLLTVSNVLRGRGISQEGQATMEPFRGNEK